MKLIIDQIRLIILKHRDHYITLMQHNTNLHDKIISGTAILNAHQHTSLMRLNAMQHETVQHTCICLLY